MEVFVRAAVPEDLDFICAAQLTMAAETEGLALDARTVRAGIDAVLIDVSKGQYWLALTGQQPIACMLCTPEWSDWRNGWVYWIQSLYVSPSYRQKGVFRKLYAHLQQMVHDRPDLYGIRLYVDKRNCAAMKTYQNMGMSSEHYDLYEWLKN